jgi:hypothetical protein
MNTDVRVVTTIFHNTAVEVVIPQKTTPSEDIPETISQLISSSPPAMEMEQNMGGEHEEMVVEDNYELGFSDVLFITFNWVLFRVLKTAYYAIDGREVAHQLIAKHLSDGTIAGIALKGIELRITTALDQLALTDVRRGANRIDEEKTC